jgi:NitT/TauT family transport system substrate-binding protein
MAEFRTTACAGRRSTSQQTHQQLRPAMNVRRAGKSAWLALLFVATTATLAAAETNIRFTLDFKIEGPSAPFLVPLDKGYYSAEGLNVTIDPALGSLQPIERVASGEYDIGFGDINALIKFRDAKPASPVKAVFMVYNRPPYAVIGRKSRGIVRPKDLEGKTLGAPSAGGAFAQWPIFAQVNNIDISKVTIENVSFPVREPMLAAGQVDAITGYSFTSYVNLKDKGVPVDDIVVLLMADYGVTLYGNAIMVNTKFAAEHPDAVQGFLRAFLKGLKDTVKQPAAAIESVMKRSGQAGKNVELERLNMAIRENIVTPEVKADGYGGIDADRFASALAQIALAYKFKAKPKLDDLFDSSFLPSAAARKYN